MSLNLSLFLPLQKQESFFSQKEDQRTGKKRKQQNDLFSIVFKKRILP